MNPLVDLRGRLSNPNIRDVIEYSAQAVAHVEIDDGSTASPRRTRRPWQLVDRLGEQLIHELLRNSRAGTNQRRLAEKSGISESSVKRLLRTSR
jgi:hypothetical protein